jgi:hypothetical protein
MTTNVTLIGHHLAAFLNSQQEGCVALGVDEDGTVHGLVMDRESRDLFSRELSVLMHEQVEGEAGDMPNLFVPRIRLQKSWRSFQNKSNSREVSKNPNNEQIVECCTKNTSSLLDGAEDQDQEEAACQGHCLI